MAEACKKPWLTFEQCSIDVIHLILELCEISSILRLARTNLVFYNLTKPYIHSTLSFKIIDGRGYEDRNAAFLKRLHSESCSDLRAMVKELRIHQEIYKSELRNTILLHAIETLVPKLGSLRVIRTNTSISQDFVQHIHERARYTSLKVFYDASLDSLTMIPSGLVGYSWYSIKLKLTNIAIENDGDLGKLLSRAPNLKELDLEANFSAHARAHQIMNYMFTELGHSCPPKLRSLRLRGYEFPVTLSPQILRKQRLALFDFCSSLVTLDIEFSLVASLQGINLPNLRVFSLMEYKGLAHVANSNSETIASDIGCFIRNSMNKTELRELRIQGRILGAVCSCWRDILLPLVSDLRILRLSNGVTASYHETYSPGFLLFNDDALRELAANCPNLQELEVDVESIKSQLPVLSAICAFPRLKSLILHLKINADYRQVKGLSTYLTETHGRYFNPLRIICDSRRTVEPDKESSNAQDFEVLYGLDSRRNLEPIITEKTVEKYRHILEMTDPREKSYHSLLEAFLACERRAYGR